MEFVRGEEPNNQEGTKIHSFHDFCPKPSLDLSENEYYCEILERQKSNHQAVREKDDDTMLQHSSSSNYYFEDPSRFVVRSGEKSWKLSKEVEFTVPDEQSAAVGSSYFDEEISGRMYGSASSDSTYLSDDCEEDSYGFTREVPSLKSSGLKRKRNAEAHSLCEKRRREKVNKKIRALRQLIPNCDKPDQASVLDKAIQYLKTLQLQLQMMSMATRFYMRPFMPQLGIQHVNPKPYFNGFHPKDMAMLMGQGYKNNPLIHGFVSMASSAQMTTANPSASAHFHLPSFMDFHQQQIYPDLVNYTESLSFLKNRNSCQEGNEKLERSCLGEKK